MTSNELRSLYLEFFRERGHTILPSSPLVPHGDPTLLFTTAGMVQIKPYFLGLQKPPNVRLVSCQKCFRTTDVDSVGDNTHLTFFEMLGNFSVGDYFKKEAIAWAWEFVTEYLHLEPWRLWASVYLDDDEAFALWEQTGVPAERIRRFGEKDNFWGPAGNSGPCGPCSELHYDMGADRGCGLSTCGPNCECGRFVEIWNLVFTEYDQKPDGSRTRLPKPNIDTGMGLERITAAVQAKSNVYETDLFTGLTSLVAGLCGKQYGVNVESDRAMRIVAEHGRGMTFLVADGVLPTNEGRGYVLRRILRRAALFGRRVGLTKPFLTEVCSAVIEQMGSAYPEIVQHRQLVLDVIQAEERRFMATLEVGVGIVDDLVERAIAGGRDTLSGDDVFRLYDTYGFPRELTAEVARERGLGIDGKGFEDALERQREKARSAHAFHNNAVDASLVGTCATEFLGYGALTLEATVIGLRQGGQPVQAAPDGTDIDIILDRSPFYGEMGGQVGDLGRISGANAEVDVHGTVRTGSDVIVHRGRVARGEITVGDVVLASVEESRRWDIARNHTATHLLQAALRNVLGTQVAQRGSYVEPERLRFDFSWMGAVEKERIADVERWVNEKIRADLPVTTRVSSYDDAVKSGAIALFDEKYGDQVRVIQIGTPPVSTELCGGTHVGATGQIGAFIIVSEASVGTGLRRIEAVTGTGAEELVRTRTRTIDAMAEQLNATPADVLDRLGATLDETDRLRRRLVALEKQLSVSTAESLLQHTIHIGGVPCIVARVDGLSIAALRELGDTLRDRMGDCIQVFATVENQRPMFLVMVSAPLAKRGLHAGEIAKRAAVVAGGGGGGKPTMAQAGGKDVAKVDEALAESRRAIEQQLLARSDG
ncbi:MAG: alanine--tRNA ligase [Dehalococcoidia bacterium]|nr:alanine--tRNA ligase [Dehalococcoidia bacterium]